LIVAGSTLEGEEAALLEAWPKLLLAHPDSVLVIAPRHPERFAAVAALLERSGRAWIRRTEWRSRAVADIEPLRPGAILLLDSIGELASVYSLAAIAFVGGSLVPAGGHNPLEPAQFGVPIVMGPHYGNFRAIVDAFRTREAILIAQKEGFLRVLSELLAKPAHAQAMGARARLVFEAKAGATGRCVAALKSLLSPDAAATEGTAAGSANVKNDSERPVGRFI
jgi:3-deoxy-D-manno-octulosonic-acid transferase